MGKHYERALETFLSYIPEEYREEGKREFEDTLWAAKARFNDALEDFFSPIEPKIAGAILAIANGIGWITKKIEGRRK